MEASQPQHMLRQAHEPPEYPNTLLGKMLQLAAFVLTACSYDAAGTAASRTILSVAALRMLTALDAYSVLRHAH